MPSERTPLVTTHRVGPQRQRYPHNVVRRFCTIALSSTLIWVLFTWTTTAILGRGRGRDHRHHDHHGHHGHHGDWSWPGHNNRRLGHDDLRKILVETPSSELSQEWSRYYTSGPHLAGQNYSQAEWTRDKWESWGINSSIVTYDVYLNRPIDHRIALLEKTAGDKHDGALAQSSWKVKFEASLREDVIDEDPTTALSNAIPTFHGYSANGNVTAQFVYVNYGTFQDFEDLIKANVSLKGKIAIARYGGIFRGLKVKRAQELGMSATLIYSDPGDDGPFTDEKGVKQYPKGTARQASSVQRGSAQFLSIAPGDPTTPGYPSTPGAPRADPHNAIPSIPSIPISYADAIPILKALNGHGPSSDEFNEYWTRNRGLEYKGVRYNVGPSPPGLVLNFYNEQNYITTPIWNVIGIINGTTDDEVVVVGNHRDAWIIGGAGDPNSGSAVINEVIRSFGKAMERGWKPLRTIVFASWDGEEYALIGSTEWVEQYLPWLKNVSVAYINTDVAVSGPNFKASGAPLLDELLYEITSQVQSPNQTVKGQTVRDLWDGRISTIGSGSDFTAFQDFAGIPCLDIGFTGRPNNAVYHYHSNYDSFHWMQNFGDPGFTYHRTMAQILGLMTASLADKPVIQFGIKNYADKLKGYIDKVEDKLDAAMSGTILKFQPDLSAEQHLFELRASHHTDTVQTKGSAAGFKRELARLREAAKKFSQRAEAADKRANKLRKRVEEDHIPWWQWPAELKLGMEIRKLNSKFKFVERQFLHAEGLDGRRWFKSVIFAPGLWTGYAGAVFPGLQESIESRDFENAVRWLGIIEDCIYKAADVLLLNDDEE